MCSAISCKAMRSDENNNKQVGPGSNVGAIVGGAVGGVGVTAAIAGVLLLCICRRIRRSPNAMIEEMSEEPYGHDAEHVVEPFLVHHGQSGSISGPLVDLGLSQKEDTGESFRPYDVPSNSQQYGGLTVPQHNMESASSASVIAGTQYDRPANLPAPVRVGHPSKLERINKPYGPTSPPHSPNSVPQAPSLSGGRGQSDVPSQELSQPLESRHEEIPRLINRLNGLLQAQGHISVGETDGESPPQYE